MTENITNNSRPKYWVIIPAAGSGQRMKSSTPKQYLTLGGKTVLEHTLDIFLRRDDIAGVVVCLAQNDQIWPTLAVASHPLVMRAQGGETRASSVVNGLNLLSEKTNDNDWVLVHDAARPCLGDDVLQRLLDEVDAHLVGGIVALPAKDTLKRCVDTQAVVEATIDRSRVWQAQTPQMFRYQLLKNSLSSALDSNVEITDESSALEAAGCQPLLIEGQSENFKITTPDDLAMAEFLLKKRHAN